MKTKNLIHNQSGQTIVGVLAAVAMVGGLVIALSQFGRSTSHSQRKIKLFNDASLQAKSIGLVLSKQSTCLSNFGGQTITPGRSITDVEELKIYDSSNNPVGDLFTKGYLVSGLENHHIEVNVITTLSPNKYLGELVLQYRPETNRGNTKLHHRSLYMSITTDASDQITECHTIGSALEEQNATVTRCPAGQIVSGFDENEEPICFTPVTPGPAPPQAPPGGTADCSPTFKHGETCRKIEFRSAKACAESTCHQPYGTTFRYTCNPDVSGHYQCMNGEVVTLADRARTCSNSATIQPFSTNTCDF